MHKPRQGVVANTLNLFPGGPLSRVFFDLRWFASSIGSVSPETCLIYLISKSVLMALSQVSPERTATPIT